MVNAIIFFIIAVCCILSLAVGASAESMSFTASLKIDNTLEFEWSDKGTGQVSIYGIPAPGSEEKTVIVENYPAKYGSYSFNLEESEMTAYSAYYVIEQNGQKTVAETKTLLPRRTTELTTLEHPYLITNQQGIDELKETIKTNKVYNTNYNVFMKKADDLCVKLAGFSDPLTDNVTRKEAEVVPFALTCLATAWVLTDDVKYLEAGRKGFDLLVNYLYDNQSIIFEMKSDYIYVEDAAIAYDLFYNALNDAERQIYENGIFRIWMERLFACIRGRSSNQGGTNHVAVILGCLLKDQDYIETGLYREGYGLWFNWLNALNDDGSMWNQPTRYYAQFIMYLYRMCEVLYNSGFDIYEMEISGERTSEFMDTTTNWRDATDGDEVTVTNLNVHKIMAQYMYYFQYMNRLLDIGDTQAYMKYSPTSTEFVKVCEILWKRYHDERAAWVLSQVYGTGERTKGYFPEFYLMFNTEPNLGNPTFEIGTGYFAKKGYNRLGSSVFGDYGQVIFRGDDATKMCTGLYWQRFVESHMHNDMFNFSLFSKGDNIIFDPGTYNYGTEGQIGYARSSIAHNSLIIDETARWPGSGEPGKGEWSDDILVNGKMTRGFLDNVAIGADAKAIRAYSDRAYSTDRNGIDSVLTRTLWQLDDYAIDIFKATSDGNIHTYDYPLNIAGELEECSRTLSEPVNPDEPLKSGATSYQYIRNLHRSGAGDDTWYTIYNVLDGTAKLRITMLGAENTELIKATAPDRSMVYNQEKLIVRRKTQEEPVFITLYEVERDRKTLRDIAEENVYVDGKQVDWAKAVSVTSGNISDRFIYGDSYGVKQSGNLYSDGESAYLRQIDGEDKALGIMSGKFISGSKIALSFRRNSSAQFALQEDGSYRLDMAQGTQQDTTVTVSGLDGYAVYEMDFETGELSFVSAANTFDVKAEGIYILTLMADAQNIEQAPVIRMLDENNKFAVYGTLLQLTEELELPKNAIIVEGEDFTEETGGEVLFGSYEDDSHTTDNEKGTAFYNWDNSGHTLTWSVDIPTAGKYYIMFRYASNAGETSVRKLTVNDGEPYVLSFNHTGTWNKPRTNVRVCDDSFNSMPFEFAQGENRITMTNINTALNIDCIAIIPAE